MIETSLRASSARAQRWRSRPYNRIVAARLYAERLLLSCILAHPLLGSEHAAQVDVQADWFADSDLRALFVAAMAMSDAGRLTRNLASDRTRICLLARSVLIADGTWNDGVAREYAAITTDRCAYSHLDVDDAAKLLTDARNYCRRLTRAARGEAA